MACLQEVAYIKAVNTGICYSKIADRPADEPAVTAVDLHEVNICCAAGCKLIAYCPGARKEVKKVHGRKIIPVVKDVKEAFTGKVSCRSCLVPGRGVDNLSPQ